MRLGARCDRRSFLKGGVGFAAGAGLGFAHGCGSSSSTGPSATPTPAAATRVAIVKVTSYGPELRDGFVRAFDLLGGIGSLVRGKTVTVKVNLTGYAQSLFGGKPPGETYATHPATAEALASVLFANGARRVRFVESAPVLGTFESYAAGFGWSASALRSTGDVEFENTRNLGYGSQYARMKVPGGQLFTAFDLNHSYADTDVLVSLAKMKNHVTAGVTLSTKNLFGITPNSLYGIQAPREDAVGYRGCLHTRSEGNVPSLPGEVAGFEAQDAYFRVPRIVADVLAARPVDLAVVDGITTIAGGEGPWNAGIRFVTPGLVVAGLNAISTDAVCVAAMGYANPLTPRGSPPFAFCDNHLLFGHEAGLGTGDLAKIEVRGLTIDQARYPFA
jgi:uncharacterized protein (DUF362 family)